MNAYKRDYIARNLERTRDVRRNSALRRKYDIDLDTYQHLLELQGGLCGICTKPLVPGKETHLDHCHATGAVRGVLCSTCNKALGLFRDDATVMSSAVDYINLSRKGART